MSAREIWNEIMAIAADTAGRWSTGIHAEGALEECQIPDDIQPVFQAQQRRMSFCQSNGDGECEHPKCPQIAHDEPKATGRHCPWDRVPHCEEDGG